VKHLLSALSLIVGTLSIPGCGPLYLQPGVQGYQISTRPFAPAYQSAEVGAPEDMGYQTVDPPPVPYGAPETVVLPGTSVYVVPDLATDLFFAGGYWWRPYGGGWYRSAYYDRGWGPYAGVPAFYGSVPRNWRYNCAHHQWNGRPWNYQRTHVQNVQAGDHGAPGGPNGRGGGARFVDRQDHTREQFRGYQPVVRNQPQQFHMSNASQGSNQSPPNRKKHN
jgi:hypothetical protein